MNEFKVGLLTLASMLSVVYMSLKVTSNQSGFGNYVKYRTLVRDASGIFPKTPIKVAGINAGRIKNIQLENNAALITFEILDNVKITSDSKLKIKSVGFLGDKYLEIVIGSSDIILQEGAVIKALEGAGFEKIMKDASEVVIDLKDIISKIKESVAPENEISPIKKILDDTKELTSNIKDVSESLKRIVNGNESKFASLITNLEKTSENLRYELDRQRTGSAMADVRDILDNVKKMSSDLKLIVADVKAGKGTVGKLIVEDDIADKVNQTLSGVNRIVNRMNSLRTEVSAFTGYNTEFGSDTRAMVNIFPSPERMYIFGISTSEFGPNYERHTTTDINGVRTNKVESYRDKGSYRFDLQMGRRLQNWTFRGGLIESTGGVGIDYINSNYSTKFSVDLFDYREDIGINFRASVDLRLWNVFYGRIMAEDLIVSDSRNYSFLTGLRFSDEDLNALIGFFF